MKIIKPSFTILNQGEGIDGMLKHIELCGRVCYKSEDKITEDSSQKFVNNRIKSGHCSVLEHGTVYLEMYNSHDSDNLSPNLQGYYKNKYSIVKRVEEKTGVNFITKIYITTNYRVLIENGWLDDLKYQCEPTEFHNKRISVRFICDRGVSHEFVRHRVFSFSQESTRYCNYSKDKFEGITYIIPTWSNLKEGNYPVIWDGLYGRFISSLSNDENDVRMFWSWAVTERDYLKLLSKGYTPQQARSVLPNALKTELIMTGTISQWKEFFKLRCAQSAHPQARELAILLLKEFQERNYL